MFLENIPDTSGYMIAGYVIAFATMGIYVFSLYLRNRNLRQDLETLESLQSDAKATKPKTGKQKTTGKK